jgi:hypothetical protein
MDIDPADMKPEMEPVYEAGGGEAEGFELAEQELVEHAGHGEHDGFLEEGIPEDAESQRAGVAYGEADEIDTTEVTRDPDSEAEDEDPGEGPGIAADR